eukprot:scaffold343744_cov15-Prasinocladus_malaysianus.AAC.2
MQLPRNHPVKPVVSTHSLQTMSGYLSFYLDHVSLYLIMHAVTAGLYSRVVRPGGSPVSGLYSRVTIMEC